MIPLDLLTTHDVSRYVQCSTSTLKRWRRRGDGPPWCTIGTRTVRYPLPLLMQWLDGKTAMAGTSTDQRAEPMGGVSFPPARSGAGQDGREGHQFLSGEVREVPHSRVSIS